MSENKLLVIVIVIVTVIMHVILQLIYFEFPDKKSLTCTYFDEPSRYIETYDYCKSTNFGGYKS